MSANVKFFLQKMQDMDFTENARYARVERGTICGTS